MSIDRYDPIRILGEGSFGKVYLMRDKIKRNFVCVKIIKIKNIPKKEREATKMEVDLLKRLHHPNIVGYIDSFLSKNHESLCICMEYCDGGDLASQIKAARRNLFSESKILHWFVQLALGLQYMHGNKVLHRDLKTQNIFLLGNGRLVLGDLGISKVLDGTMDFAQTCIGTPYYMSPEIFQNKPYSYKSDVWALGCVLYEMTTLNHAFDANSLNGLATKIVKGKYPPIHAKYSRYLRELIAQMLMISPQQRPDMDQILRKPFIKKHIVNFFVDIASRPSTSIGEGTMVFKAAAGGAVNGNSYNDSTMISLRQQLNSLDMADAVAEAMKPKGNPQDDQEAIKFAREQASALKREQEHKKMVEAALEKLRLERESRAKLRNDPYKQPQPRAAPAPLPSGRRDEPVKRPSAPNAPPLQLSPPAQPIVPPNRNVSNEALRKEARDNSKDRLPAPSRNEDVTPVAAAGGRRRTFGEEKDSRDKEKIEREKKAVEDRRRVQEQEAARIRAEDRRREEVRAEARAREEARLREVAKLREEQEERMRMEQVRERAEAAARAKREAQRERERERQREEIEQLKRDKLELDRRASERERVREERRAEERLRLDERRREQMDIMQSKLDSMNDQIGKLELNRPNNRAEEKGEEYMSARERVYLRRQEKQAKEEQERLEALREAEFENRRIRANAQQEFRNKVFGDNVAGLQGNPGNVVNRNRSSDPNGEEENPRYEFDPQNRNRKGRMDGEELADRLEDANRGKGTRYDSDLASERRNSGRSGVVNPDGNKSSGSSTQLNEDGSDSEQEEELFRKGDANLDEEEEDLHRREEELQAELTFATLRVEELRRTLQETKSFLGPRLPTRGKDVKIAVNPTEHTKEVVNEDEEDEEDLYELEESDEYEENFEDGSSGKQRGGYTKPSNIATNLDDYYSQMEGGDRTLRRVKPESANPYGGLQDAPSPSGKLSDRIERLRQRCMEALGRDAFMDAYSFLKQHEMESQGYDNGRDLNDDDFEAKKVARVRAILGEGKAHYISLIDQLIFMEGAERDY